MKIFALVVIYNKKCQNSATLSSLKGYGEDINVIVFDNSTSDFANENYCKKNEIKYFSLGENVGLSRAYNYVIKKCKFKDDDYLMLFDDDTSLNKEYFSEVLSRIAEGYDLLLPIVEAGGTIISPAIMRPHRKVKPVKSMSAIDDVKWLTGINSGMVVKCRIYNSGIIYDEKIFLDYVDHDFMLRIRKRKPKIKILNAKIDQAFSRKEKGSKQGAITRFRIFKKDYKVFSEKHVDFSRYKLSMLKYAITECLRYRTMVFLKELYVD